MLEQVDLNKLFFIDIETVPEFEHFNLLDDQVKDLFSEKTKYKRKEEISAEDFYQNAGIWAEFGKIICISVGFFNKNASEEGEFRITSFYGEEKDLLHAFIGLLEKHFDSKEHVFCGHNIKEFDLPYIARRLLINQITLPKELNLYGKKPWEVRHIDTMELWKFGDYKHFTSLKLLTKVLGIESPKDQIDGSDVQSVYYKEQDLQKIITYCEKDVLAVAQVVLRLKNLPLIKPEQITHVLQNKWIKNLQMS